MTIWFDCFPLPPSVNGYLASFEGRHVKTKIHRTYMNECQMWSLLNRSSFDRHKRYLKDRFEYDLKNEIPFSLRVDTYFVFEKKRIISKNNKVMKLDADNRLKPLRDAISHVLEIDDKHFFAGECEKVFTDLKDNECAMIRLQYMSPRSLDEVLNLMRTDRERNAQIRSRDS